MSTQTPEPGGPVVDFIINGAAQGMDIGAISPTDAGQLSPADIKSILQDTIWGTRSRWVGTWDAASQVPPWAQSLTKEVLGDEEFDPFGGFSSAEDMGDNAVYMGSKVKEREIFSPPQQRGFEDRSFTPWQAELAGDVGDALNVGMATPEDYHKVPGESKTVKEEKHRVMTVDAANNLIYGWDEAKVQRVMERFREAGLKADTFDELETNWKALVKRAAKTLEATNGERRVTPWDMLDLVKRESAGINGADGQDSADGPFTGTKKQVNRSVSEFSEGEVWATMQTMMSQMLGRDPSDDELREFAYKMNHAAAKNPSVSTSIAKYKDGELQSTSTHNKPGFTAADMQQSMYEEAQADDDYAEYQAATTFFNALMSALGPMGDVG